MICIEYVWIGGKNECRSKTKVVDHKVDTIDDVPDWNFDGSSCYLAKTEDSEIYIKPRCLFKDPFRKNDNVIVLCDNFLPDGETPHPKNTRVYAEKIFENSSDEDPWFGLEQEYFLFDPKTNKPIGFPSNGFPNPQGQYYCAIGASNAFGRDIAEEHLQACIYAGVGITGINFEVAPGQLEFQVKETGIKAGDHLWMARYLLYRIAEKYGLDVDIEPKPIKGDWNGSGAHTNFSTKLMREGDENKTGLQYIEEALVKLAKKHKEHIAVYGKGNHERLTGIHETSSMDKFTFGRGNRGASVRILSSTIKNQKGYFEDRRPASNMDPWLVTAKIYETTSQ